MLDRRQLIIGGVALTSLPGCAFRPATAAPLTVALLGQALIEHAATPATWPGRPGIAARLAETDAVFTNLETVIRGPRSGAPTRELLTLHAAEPAVLETLKSIDVNLLTTANNHAFDLGSGGILDTLAATRASGLISAGAGATLGEASAPAIVGTPAGRVAAVGFATGKVREGGAATNARPGVNELKRGPDGVPDATDEARILAAITEGAARSDFVIACHHNHDWEPDNAEVPAWQQALARRCIDAGADVFAGHGSPVPQGMALHSGKPLLYGLGNFVFQTEKVVGSYPPEAWTGIIVHMERRSDGGVATSLKPITLNEIGLGGSDDIATRGFPSLASDAEAGAILARIDALSRVLGGKLEISGTTATLSAVD